MKKNLLYVTSLTLGLALASCQNDVNEPILMDEVQNELATTRANDSSVIPLEGDVEDIISELSVAASSGTITGPRIVGGTATVEYSITDVPIGTTPTWSYSTAIFTQTSITSDKKSIHLQTNGLTSGYDTAVMVYFYNTSDGSLDSYRVLYVGINGPHYNDCSIRVIRSSDGAEVYPSHTVYMEPNTYYYAYFSTTTGGNMNLTWTFYDNDVYKLSEYGHTLYFKTGDIENCFLHVDGSLAGSSIVKSLLGIVLY